MLGDGFEMNVQVIHVDEGEAVVQYVHYDTDCATKTYCPKMVYLLLR